MPQGPLHIGTDIGLHMVPSHTHVQHIGTDIGTTLADVATDEDGRCYTSVPTSVQQAPTSPCRWEPRLAPLYPTLVLFCGVNGEWPRWGQMGPIGLKEIGPTRAQLGRKQAQIRSEWGPLGSELQKHMPC